MKKSIIISIVAAAVLILTYLAVRLAVAYKVADVISDEAAYDCKLVKPLPAGIDIDNLEDCTVPAAFTKDDFRWMGGNLRLTVYSKDLYDAVEVTTLKVGDTLIYASTPLIINNISEVHGGIEINGGLEEGGCTLAPYEGGTYVGRDWDDHATYTKLGSTEVALASDFVIIDCGDFPEDPSVTITEGQKLYLETLKPGHQDFFPLNTQVTIQSGLITEIRRHWIP